MTNSSSLKGGCHCGKIKLELFTSLSPEEFHPRACDCSFCLKHGASYISDPKGSLAIEVTGPDALAEYRQGSLNARFLVCRSCGVLVAALHDDGARTFGTVNSRCMDPQPAFGTPRPVSPQKLGGEEKKERWVTLWTPEVTIRIS